MNIRNTIILYIIVLTVIVGLLFFLRNYEPDIPRDYEAIVNEGVLRVVTDYNSFDYYLSDDTVAGLQYEICKAISELSKLEVEIFPETSLNEGFDGLNKRKYDVLAANISVTSELRKQYSFTEPFAISKYVLIQRQPVSSNDSTYLIRNQLDLAGKTVYIPAKSPASLRINNLGYEIGDTIYIFEDPLYSSEQLIIMVAHGDIDYAVCDYQSALSGKKRFPSSIDISTDISFTFFRSWAVRKESKVLLDSLNAWLNVIRSKEILGKQVIHLSR